MSEPTSGSAGQAREPANGALADRYRIERELGAGGMATVYLAHDLRHDRKVAIKVMRPELAAVIGAERFLTEIKTTANLQHPHILPLFDSGSAGSYLFYVMPFVEGETVRDRLSRERQLPVADAVRIATEVASALDYAHRHGVIHRDIKPENILLHDGRALVADFGIALAATQADSRMTQTGMSLGTPKYMSPEQAMGERTLDARTDVYALGSVLYEMLVGEPPFTGPSAQAIVAKVLNAEPPALSAQRKSIPPHVEAAVLTALAKLPADRFASAAEFAAALNTAPPRPDDSAARSVPATRPRRSLLTIVGAVGAGAALVALGVAAEWVRAGATSPSAAAFTQQTFSQQAIFNARFAPDGKTIVFSAAPDGAVPALFLIRPGYPEPQPLGLTDTHLLSISSTGELAVLVRARYLGFRRFEGTLASVPLEGRAPREIADSVREADWSPDGSQLVIIHDVKGRDRLEFPIGTSLVEAAGYLSDPRVSPDGKLIAFVEHPLGDDDRGTIDIVDRTGKKTVLAGPFATVQGLAWSAKGGELLFSAADHGTQRVVHAVTPAGRLRTALAGPGGLTMHDITRTGRVLLTRDDAPSRLMVRRPGTTEDVDESWLDASFAPALSRDGSLMAFGDAASDAGPNYSVMLRRTDSGSVTRLGEGYPEDISADGRWVLAHVPSTPPRLVLYPTGVGAERRIDTGPLEVISSAGLFPDGRAVLICGVEAAQGPRCYQRSLDGGALRPITPDGTQGGLISPDGAEVVALNLLTRTHRRYASDTDSGRPIPGLAADEIVVGWSADGQALYVQQANRFKVDRLDLATGARQFIFDVTAAPGSGVVTIPSVAFAEDPRVYAYVASTYLSQLFVVDSLRP